MNVWVCVFGWYWLDGDPELLLRTLNFELYSQPPKPPSTRRSTIFAVSRVITSLPLLGCCLLSACTAIFSFPSGIAFKWWRMDGRTVMMIVALLWAIVEYFLTLRLFSICCCSFSSLGLFSRLLLIALHCFWHEDRRTLCHLPHPFVINRTTNWSARTLLITNSCHCRFNGLFAYWMMVKLNSIFSVFHFASAAIIIMKLFCTGGHPGHVH